MQRLWIWMVILGCSDGGQGMRSLPTTAGDSAPTCEGNGACECADGTDQGADACGTPCTCDDMLDGFGNSDEVIDTSHVNDAPTVTDPRRTQCEPGLYLGQYNCELALGGLPFPLTGDVSFNLAVNEQVVESENCQEFCADLVIAEGTGTLFGLAGLFGFEAQLEGGLDCQTGEFRASADTGIYGSPVSSDPTDPDALWTVLQPPAGTFTGSLTGTHTTDVPQTINGDWDLLDEVFGATCVGPFSVSLQP